MARSSGPAANPVGPEAKGDAVLPLPASAGPTMLEIRASSSGMIYLAGADQDRRAA